MLLNGNMVSARVLPKGIMRSADIAMYLNSDKNKYWFVICLYKSVKFSVHVIRVLVVRAILLLCVVTARAQFIPENFEKHGHYLIGAVIDEMNRPIRNQTHGSCLACNPNVKQVHLE